MSTRRARGVALACALALVSNAHANARSRADAAGAPAGKQVEVPAYAIDWRTNDAGGGRSLGGTYAVTGTAGQADADPLQPSNGGLYQIDGGFWGGSAPGNDLFRDSFE